ncbi:hypothetical protein Nepgr_022059 [Nepenthes gracilis]|uniref:Uncharacterized protein n=1 Tax=Nepenthes gracilis TaxID=150966 RepID=A0AAD3XWL7_NEPGR|nr:hypothetical protein Nepgr_022059 [Nepenthes gracilis]
MLIVRKKPVVCLFFLLLVLLPLERPFFADGHGRFNKVRSGSSSTELRRVKSHGFFFRGNAEKNAGGDDDMFDDDKRKINTGPNPLHNR